MTPSSKEQQTIEQEIRFIIDLTYSNGSVSEQLPGGIREEFKDKQVSKLLSLIRDEKIKELYLIIDKLYDIRDVDWGVPTKWSVKEWGENHADLWIPMKAAHEVMSGRLQQLREEN